MSDAVGLMAEEGHHPKVHKAAVHSGRAVAEPRPDHNVDLRQRIVALALRPSPDASRGEKVQSAVPLAAKTIDESERTRAHAQAGGVRVSVMVSPQGA